MLQWCFVRNSYFFFETPTVFPRLPFVFVCLSLVSPPWYRKHTVHELWGPSSVLDHGGPWSSSDALNLLSVSCRIRSRGLEKFCHRLYPFVCWGTNLGFYIVVGFAWLWLLVPVLRRSTLLRVCWGQCRPFCRQGWSIDDRHLWCEWVRTWFWSFHLRLCWVDGGCVGMCSSLERQEMKAWLREAQTAGYFVLVVQGDCLKSRDRDTCGVIIVHT